MKTDGKMADWVIDSPGMIKKASLTFVALLFWVLV